MNGNTTITTMTAFATSSDLLLNTSEVATTAATVMTNLATDFIQESTVANTLSNFVTTTFQDISTSVFENSSVDTNITKNTSGLIPPKRTFGKCFAFNSSLEKHVDLLNTHVYNNIYIPSLILTIVLFILGTPGNMIVFYVYLRRWRKTTSRIFILALAGFDLVNCTIMPFEMAIITHIVKFDYPGVCKFSRLLTFMMNNCSSFTLLVISMDRYVRICSPLKTPINNRQAKIWILISIVGAIAFSWPAGIFYGTFTLLIPSKIPGVCIVANLCLVENQYQDSQYPLYFTTTLLAGTLFIDLVLIICYSCIAYRVIQRSSFEDRCKCRKDSMASCSTENDVLDVQTNSPIVIRQMSYNLSAEAAGKINAKANEGKIESTPLEAKETKENSKKSAKGGSKKGFKNRKGSESSSLGSSMKAFISRRSSESGSAGGSIRGKSQSAASKRLQFQKQRSMSSQSIESRRAQMYKTTLMLFLVTLLFIVSFVPYCAIVIMRYLNPPYYNSLSDNGKAVYQLFLRTYLLSSALNPLIYSFLSAQFRAECKAVFCNILSTLGCKKFGGATGSLNVAPPSQ